VPKAKVVAGARAKKFTADPNHFKLGGVAFHRHALVDALHTRCKMAPDTYGVSFLLAGSQDQAFALTWVNTDGGAKDVYLPCPRWFTDLDAAASISPLPPFFV
jgi:hypothetical protein